MDDDIPYLLLTPGPLTTSRGVRQSMLRDYCTWDDEYHAIVTAIRDELARLAGGGDATAVLMQGSGTFSVEATFTTAVPRNGRVLVVNNGAYGKRMVEICRRSGIDCHDYFLEETEPVAPSAIEEVLRRETDITHVAVVHCETTTGLLNPVESLGKAVKAAGRIYIVDAMSSFGGLPITMESTRADFLVSSANKCIQGVPGFGFVIAGRAALVACEGQARSLSLDLFDQWREMEHHHGKWRFTSPTHVVRAFATALEELREEGGVPARYARYCENHRRLVEGMQRIGFRPLLASELQSPVITSFLYPPDPCFTFREFYDRLKRHRFVIYPGKISAAETFRIGTIGHVFPQDIDGLLGAVAAVVAEMQLQLGSDQDGRTI